MGSYTNVLYPAIKPDVSKITIANDPVPAARLDEMGSLPNSSANIGTRNCESWSSKLLT